MPAKLNSQTSLPPLPENFWRLSNQIIEAWEELESLMDREWKALSTRDINMIWKLSEKKISQTQKIQKLEGIFLKAIENILKKTATNYKNEEIIRAFKKVINFNDLFKLEDWQNKREQLRIKIQIQNQKHISWMEAQAQLARELMNIITQGIRNSKKTYSPPVKKPSKSLTPSNLESTVSSF